MVTFSENKAGGEYYYYGSGGAIVVVNGNFITEVSTMFYNNKAEYEGGAILLKHVNSKLLGSIIFDNTAFIGDALHIAHVNISFNVDQTENTSSLTI